MTAKLAIPTFIGGAKDELAAIDVYKEAAGDAVINSIQEAYLGAAGDDLDILGLIGGDAMAQYAQEALGSLSQALPTEADVLARIGDVASPVTDALRDMTTEGKTALLGSITASLSPLTNITATIGEITKQVTGSVGNFQDLQAIGTMVNAMAGSNVLKFTDVSAVSSVLSSVVSKASSMGIPNAFGTVMQYGGISSSLGSLANSAINQVVRTALPAVARAGDLSSIASMSTMLGAGGVRALMPNAINTVATNFTMPQGSTLSDYEQACAVAQSTFSSIDPTWNSYVRPTTAGNQTVTSITALQGATVDFQRMIQVGAILSNSSTQKLQLLTQIPGVGSVMQSLTRDFPRTVIRNVVNLGTVDPRIASTAGPVLNRQTIQAGVEAPVRPTFNASEDPWGTLVDRSSPPYYMPVTVSERDLLAQVELR